ncbi:MAG: Qat anti-phage system associated protein QatB [Ignavibacteriaceae bacterium]
MGTTTPNTGPSNNTPLEPSWANEPLEGEIPTDGVPEDGESSPDAETQEEEEGANQNEHNEPVIPIDGTTGDWSVPRRRLSYYAKNPNSGNLKSAAKSYVRASGGSKDISRSVGSGKRTAAKLGGFLSSIATEGLKSTFDKFNLGEIKGLSAEVAMNKIVAYLSPSGATNEDTIVQVAIVNTLSKLYEDYSLEENELSSLENLSNEDIQKLLLFYTSSFIYTKWFHELGLKIEDKNISASKVVLLEKRAKDFIHSTVKYEFGEFDFIKSNYHVSEINNMIDTIFETAYTFIEDL